MLHTVKADCPGEPCCSDNHVAWFQLKELPLNSLALFPGLTPGT